MSEKEIRQSAAWSSRTEQLLGADAVAALQRSRVLVVGVGGVGAYAAEMLVRAGVGSMTIVDGDQVSDSNINRQLVALHSTRGMEKVDVLSRRLLDINPALDLRALCHFLEEGTIDGMVDFGEYDFVVDAIDTLSPKVALILAASRRHVPIISSMGAGAKSDPTKIQYGEIFDTYHCALAKAVRTRLKAEGFRQRLPVVFSTEQADRSAIILTENERNKKSTAGTVSYMPAIFGCYLASYVIKRLGGERKLG